jgi:hypothetical protein
MAELVPDMIPTVASARIETLPAAIIVMMARLIELFI